MIAAGNLFGSISAEFQGFNLEYKPDATKHHDEGGIVVECQEDSGIDDTLNFVGNETATGYHLEVKINSEVNIGLWSQGKVILDFNNTSKKWTLTTRTGEDTIWKVSNQGAIIATIVAGLECYASKNGESAESARKLADHLKTVDSPTIILADAA